MKTVERAGRILSPAEPGGRTARTRPAAHTRPQTHTLLQVNDGEARAELPPEDEVRFAEALRVSPEAAELAASLLLALFPNRSWARAHVGRLTAYSARPPLDQTGARRLFDKLFELSERQEWRARHAVAREVTDVAGRRLELLVPVPPRSTRAARAWSARSRPSRTRTLGAWASRRASWRPTPCRRATPGSASCSASASCSRTEGSRASARVRAAAGLARRTCRDGPSRSRSRRAPGCAGLR